MKTLSIVYTVECLEEHMPIEGNVLASGDDAEDRDAELQTRQALYDGNEWAWCTVKVTASVEGIGLEGTSYLGGCSYASEAEFLATQDDGDYADMKHGAAADLIKQLKHIQKAICGVDLSEVLS